MPPAVQLDSESPFIQREAATSQLAPDPQDLIRTAKGLIQVTSQEVGGSATCPSIGLSSFAWQPARGFIG